MQRLSPAGGRRVHVRARRQQLREHGAVAARRRAVQGRPALLVLHVHLGALRQQMRHHLAMAPRGRPVQRRPPVAVPTPQRRSVRLAGQQGTDASKASKSFFTASRSPTPACSSSGSRSMAS